ncbi:LWamide neuropeptides-like isoform X2 [Clytia hemisphaerica]|uniref:LWamide neuropeptides-like isoform X2 n=1 Tax=Clytia hemisphaerica TaxID=252671 RepID=UPI0034D3D1EB
MGVLETLLLVCFGTYIVYSAPSHSTRNRRSIELYKRILTDFKDLLDEEETRRSDPSIWRKDAKPGLRWDAKPGLSWDSKPGLSWDAKKPGLSWGQKRAPGLRWGQKREPGLTWGWRRESDYKPGPGLAWKRDKPGLSWGNDHKASDSKRPSSGLQSASGRGGDTQTKRDYKILERIEKVLKDGLSNLDDGTEQELPTRFMTGGKKDSKDITNAKKSVSNNEEVLSQLKDIIKNVMKKDDKIASANQKRESVESTNDKQALKRDAKDLAPLYKRIVDDLNNVFSDPKK